MTLPNDQLMRAIHTLAATLPAGVAATLGRSIGAATPGAWATIHAVARAVLPTPAYRAQVRDFIALWQAAAPHEPPQSIALALAATAYALERERQAQTIELVWTGPASHQPLRRTAQVLQSVIDEARHDLLIVSYAVYDIPEIGAALLRATQRGVRLRLVIESPQASAGKVAYDGLAAFGAQVAAHAAIYRWPADQRPTDAGGRYGALHAKCAVADEQVLLISSANLTRYALDLNMELGVLIRGGPQPRDVTQHIHDLIAVGTLTLMT